VSKNTLILTASYGEGHNTAAKGLKAAIDARLGMAATIHDPFPAALGEKYQSSRLDYLHIVNNFPLIWSSIYHLVDALPVGFAAPTLLDKMTRQLALTLRDHRPDCILSVYPLYPYLLPDALLLAGLPPVPTLTVITDSITINSVWHRRRTDGFIVPNPQSARVLRIAGIPEHLILDDGFPVSPRFYTESISRPDPSATNRLKVLFMINGNRERSREIAAQLLQREDIATTVTVGHDTALGDDLAGLVPPKKTDARILGWVSDIPALLREHHLLIGKAGGATVQESLAAVTPMLITQIFPGQEEGNAKLLLENGCGRFAEKNADIFRTIDSLCVDDFTRWHRMKDACQRLSRPNASLRIAERVESLIDATRRQGIAPAA
jgi:UDP-N-acetylglucosamine:LPS N-acetylglucosamine transferase